jgi:hypothetical protein
MVGATVAARLAGSAASFQCMTMSARARSQAAYARARTASSSTRSAPWACRAWARQASVSATLAGPSGPPGSTQRNCTRGWSATRAQKTKPAGPPGRTNPLPATPGWRARRPRAAAPPTDPHPVGDIAGGVAGEAGAVLGVEGLGDLGGQGPADNGDVEDVGGAQRRGGGGRMVGMAGDARGVEDHERLRRHRTRRGKHVSDHDRHPDVAQRAVGVVEQPRPPCAEHPPAASASSPSRTARRSPSTPCSVDASPCVRHRTPTSAPSPTMAASTAPSPKDSSSGCATTARTRSQRGSRAAGRVPRDEGRGLGR